MSKTAVARAHLGAILATLLLAAPAIGHAAQTPSGMEPISGVTVSTAAATATKNVLALNSEMFELYGDAGRVFQKNILAQHPVILGLFSGAGGRFILYRPGMAPLEAPSVPVVYQLLKSIGHSTMALAEVVGPYLDNPANQAWRGSLLAYRSRMQSALDGAGRNRHAGRVAGEQPQHPEEQHRLHGRMCAQGRRSRSPICRPSPRQQAPLLKMDIAWAAQTQVDHWMEVIAGWKKHAGRRLG